MSEAATMQALSERLRDVVVGVRGELDVSRHIFRAGPAYVLRDPVTFQTHRFEPGDYRILNAIDRSRTLGETFDALVSQGVLDARQEEAFYSFILELHQRNLLSLPVSDGDSLFQRSERRRRSERLARLLGIFFLRVPLINPDRFLTRTSMLFSWLFTFPALIAWTGLAMVAGFIAVTRWDDLSAPVLTVLEGNNLLMLWGTLIGLKVIHEFGHAYACKAYGGHVPEIGAFLVVFTPLAYVDATDSWSFSTTRQRAVVTLAGVYVESIVGAIALIVWALTEPSTLNTLAYQVVLLATVTTALFNLNPLLRYDAYYLVSDLFGVPNLRARCRRAVASLLKRLLYGLSHDARGRPLEHHPGLVTFGLAQLAYRVVIVVAISTMLIVKFGGLGIVMAGLVSAMMFGPDVAEVLRYVLASEELASRRFRAVAVTFGGGLAALLGAALVPVPWPLDVRGVVTFEHVQTVRAPHDGVIRDRPADAGELLLEGQTLVRLANRTLRAERDRLEAESRRGWIETVRSSFESRPEGEVARAMASTTSASLARVSSDLDELTIMAERPLRVLDVHETRAGTRVAQGDPLLRVAAGAPEAVFLLRTLEYEALRLEVGDEVVCRSPAMPDEAITGRVTHISGLGSRRFQERHADAARILMIPTDAATGDAAEPHFEVRVRLDAGHGVRATSTVRARFPSENLTTAHVMERRITRFLNRVKQELSSP